MNLTPELLLQLQDVLKFYANKNNYIAGSAKTEGFISKVEADDWGNKARELLNKLES